MAALSHSVDEYLALRHALGARLRQPEFDLRRFIEFAAREGAEIVTSDLALRWAVSSERASAATKARRLSSVRGFATWLAAVDPRTEVPPRDLLSHRFARKPPYIYSDEEVSCLIAEAGRLYSPSGHRALTYAALYGLLAVTGMRLSEALGLDCDDVNLEGKLLAIRHAKFGKSRFVPLHDSACFALQCYVGGRGRLRPRPSTSAFFVTERGTRVSASSARYTFALVSRAVGLRPPTVAYRHGSGPRLHDLRHRLAVRTLVRWYREGKDVERELPKLSTFLGHVHVADTYWYLQAVPELLQLAAERATGRKEPTP